MSTLAASYQRRRSPPTRVGQRRLRLHSRTPCRRLTGHSPHVRDAPFRKCITERGDHTESRVRNNRRRRQSLLAQLGDLVECYLPLRLERHLFWNRRLPPPPTIAGPRLRKVQAIGSGNAHRLVGHGDRNRDLAVVLLSQNPTVLSRHPDRVTSLLRNPRVVYDPRGHRALTLHLLQHVLPRHPQDLFILPRRIGAKVMQGLIPSPHVARIDAGRHRLPTLIVS